MEFTSSVFNDHTSLDYFEGIGLTSFDRESPKRVYYTRNYSPVNHLPQHHHQVIHRLRQPYQDDSMPRKAPTSLARSRQSRPTDTAHTNNMSSKMPRESPRINKGKNGKYQDDTGDMDPIPRKKAKTNSLAPIAEDSPPHGISASANTTDSPSSENDSTASEGVNMSGSAGVNMSGSADQRAAAWDAMALEQKTKDRLLKKDKLVEVTSNLRKENQILKENLHFAEQNLEKAKGLLHRERELTLQLDDKVQKLAANGCDPDLAERYQVIKEALKVEKSKREKLEKKLQDAINYKHHSVSKRSAKLTVINKELKATLQGQAKTVLWGMVKFIQSPEEEEKAARLLVHYGNIPLDQVDTKEKRRNIVALYKSEIKKSIFEKRNYASAEEKKYYVKMWKAGKTTLSVEDLIMCLKREINTDADKEKFMTYWEELLPKQVGSMEWNDKTKYYVTISKAKRTDGPKSSELDLITPEDEAFLAISVQNGVQRWRDEFDRATNVAAPEEGRQPNNGLFTSTTSGQNQYGGWNQQGLELFKTYVAWNEAARKKESTVQLEDEILQKLRIKRGITSENPDDHEKQKQRKKNAKKRGIEVPLPLETGHRAISTIRYVAEDSSDSEDDDSD